MFVETRSEATHIFNLAEIIDRDEHLNEYFVSITITCGDD